ncbi:DUF2110 family protein [Halococcoides cellulosivorans]|uniref:DUF2110 domain-containing protein n=1 Tax=Halococcoides cellulosivorans TaxID=1679096 RepID=A0A2R4WXV2_9EURY|nr:DUF2110 family protein [Halococcoides cellulosivorans]AWB26369.1 DUF2110 domain-containing protein [Halococcoides cellulosivorans]
MVVLASKVTVRGEARERALDGLESMVGDAIGELDVEWTIGVRDDDFPSVTIEGPDAAAARSVLGEQWGTITPQLTDGEVHVGTLNSWDADGIVLDAGQPVHIPADQLGLGEGGPSRIRRRFGLVQHLPMQFVAGETPRLADAERDRLFEWTRGDGRVNVNNVTRSELRATLNRAGHAEDIVTIERLGLLEQSVVCTPETAPPGLIASVGKYLPAEMLAVTP